MFSDGYAHSLEWFADTYKDIPVSREDFPAEKEKGLYWFTGDLLIPEGTEQIVFTYRNPDGALIQRENVFVVRDGEKGNPAPQYLGMFANPPAAREDNTPLQKGDTYLNKTDRNLYRYDGLDWIAVPDEDPGWWEALGDAVKEAAESGVQITAANAWVEKLVAGTVLAQKLFAKEITIPEGGVIQSQNFSEETQGFRILGNGKIEINNGYLKSNDFKETSSQAEGWSIGYPDDSTFIADVLSVSSIHSRMGGLRAISVSGIKTADIIRRYSFIESLHGFSFLAKESDGKRLFSFFKNIITTAKRTEVIYGYLRVWGYLSSTDILTPVFAVSYLESEDLVYLWYPLARSDRNDEGDPTNSNTNIKITSSGRTYTGTITPGNFVQFQGFVV